MFHTLITMNLATMGYSKKADRQAGSRISQSEAAYQRHSFACQKSQIAKFPVAEQRVDPRASSLR